MILEDYYKNFFLFVSICISEHIHLDLCLKKVLMYASVNMSLHHSHLHLDFVSEIYFNVRYSKMYCKDINRIFHFTTTTCITVFQTYKKFDVPYSCISFILRKWLLRGFMWLDTRLMCLKTSKFCYLFCMQHFIQVWINSLFTKVIIMRSRCQD